MNNDDLKRQVLNEIESAVKVVSDKLAILEALDNDSSTSGCCDLHDQLISLSVSLETFEKATSRAKAVVLQSGIASKNFLKGYESL